MPEEVRRAGDDLLRVFVVGCARGGTTITQKTLAESFGLFSLPETRLFPQMAGNSEARIFTRTHRPRPWLKRRTSDLREAMRRSTGREFIQTEGPHLPRSRKWRGFRAVTRDFAGALDSAARDGGYGGWLEKTPAHVFYGTEIARYFPDAWVVHVLRDPMDTIASIWSLAQTHPRPWGANYDRIERVVDHWNSATSASAAMVGQPRQIFVPYRLLASNPDAVTARLGAIFDRPVLREPRVQHSLARDNEAWKSGAMQAPITAAHSKWDSALSLQDQDKARALIRPMPAPLVAAMADLEARAGDADPMPNLDVAGPNTPGLEPSPESGPEPTPETGLKPDPDAQTRRPA